MAEYTYRTVDLKTSRVYEDIDLTSVKIQRKLSAVGTMTAELYIPSGARGRLLELATVPGRTGIYVLRDDVPIWGGIIWKKDWDERDYTYTLSCGSWESYAYHLVQRQTFLFPPGTDQFQIARRILLDNDLQGQSQISFPNATCGVLRERAMYAYERKTVGAELDSLAKLQNGFDYRVESYLDGDTLSRRYVFGYPSFGKTLTGAGSDLTFAYPGNLQPYKHSQDAENAGWLLYTVGAGEGADTVLAEASNNAYAQTGWPRLELVNSYKTIELYPTLKARADADLLESLPPVESFTFQLTPSSEVTLGDFNEGDRAIFSVESRRWDAPRVFTARIGLIDITPEDDEHLETIALGLVDEGTL